MGAATYDPDTGSWSDETSRDDFDKSSRWERGQPEMGYGTPTGRREYDPRDYPQTDLQIIPVTPEREEERKDRWQPGWKIEDVIRNGNTPAKRTPTLN